MLLRKTIREAIRASVARGHAGPLLDVMGSIRSKREMSDAIDTAFGLLSEFYLRAESAPLMAALLQLLDDHDMYLDNHRIFDDAMFFKREDVVLALLSSPRVRGRPFIWKAFPYTKVMQVMLDHPRYDPRQDPTFDRFLADALEHPIVFEFLYRHPRLHEPSNMNALLKAVVKSQRPMRLQALLELPVVNPSSLDLFGVCVRDIEMLEILRVDGRVDLQRLRGPRQTDIEGLFAKAAHRGYRQLAQSLLELVNLDLPQTVRRLSSNIVGIIKYQNLGTETLRQWMLAYPDMNKPRIINALLHRATEAVHADMAAELLNYFHADPGHAEIAGAYGKARRFRTANALEPLQNKLEQYGASVAEDPLWEPSSRVLINVVSSGDMERARRLLDIVDPHHIAINAFMDQMEKGDFRTAWFLMETGEVDIIQFIASLNSAKRYRTFVALVSANVHIAQMYFQGSRFFDLEGREQEYLLEQVMTRRRVLDMLPEEAKEDIQAEISDYAYWAAHARI